MRHETTTEAFQTLHHAWLRLIVKTGIIPALSRLVDKLAARLNR